MMFNKKTDLEKMDLENELEFTRMQLRDLNPPKVLIPVMENRIDELIEQLGKISKVAMNKK